MSEARTDDHTLHAAQLLADVLDSNILAIHEMQLGFHIIIYTCQVKTLADALVGILQVVFAHQSDMYFSLGIALLV